MRDVQSVSAPDQHASLSPLVTVVIPTYNRWPLVAAAVESVLAQHHAEVEVIVVDDGSTDGTHRLLAQTYPSVHVLRQANGERGAARNRGAQAARGTYLSFLDSDDVLDPWHVSQLVSLLARRREDDHRLPPVVAAPAVLWEPVSDARSPCGGLGLRRKRSLAEAALVGTVLPLPGLFVSRDAFDSLGGFPEDPALARSEDWVFLSRLTARFPVVDLPSASVRIRSHPGRSMDDPVKVIESRLAAMRLVLEDGVRGEPLDERSRRLVVGGTHRLCAAHFYGAGMMKPARHHLRDAFIAFGWRDGTLLLWRMWAQTLLGPRGSQAARQLRLAVAGRTRRRDADPKSVPRSDGAVHVLLVTQTGARDRLLNAIVDHSDPAATRYSVVTLLAESGPLWSDMASRGVAVRSLGASNGSLESVPLAIWRLRKLIRSIGPDVIHSLLFYPGLVTECCRLPIADAPPSLLVRHHNEILHLERRVLHWRADGWMARRATRVVAVSQSVAQTVVGEGVSVDHVAVIHNGLDWDAVVTVDPTSSDQWRQRFDGHRLLVAAGRLTHQKDYPTLLRAVARVVSRYPDAYLLVAGTGPDEEVSNLRRLAGSLGIAASVEFAGWVPDVYDLMAAADVFVQASIDEACPQSIIEAVGLGIPVAVTTPGGVPEVVGRAYGHVAPGDDRALADRICEQLADLNGARTKAKDRASTVRDRFAAPAMAEGYIRLYRQLAGSRGDVAGGQT